MTTDAPGGDLVHADCEWLSFGFPIVDLNGGEGTEHFTVVPAPVRTGHRAGTFRVATCPSFDFDDREPVDCSGTYRVEDRRGRLIGTGSLLPAVDPRVRVKWTPLGRRLVERGVVATVTAFMTGGDFPPRLAWRTRLRR